MPRFYLNLIEWLGAERIDECTCQAAVGDERHIEVDGCTTYLVAIVELGYGEILWYVDHHINLLIAEHIESLWLTILRRPIDLGARYIVLTKELIGATRSIEGVAMLHELARCIEHLNLLLRRTRGEEYILLRYALSYGEHSLEYGTAGVIAYTSYLTRGCHIDTQHGVSLLQAVERELTRLDTYVVEVEEILVRFLKRHIKHHFSSKVYEVEF